MEQSCLQVLKPASGKSVWERNWLYLLFNMTNHGSSIPCLCSLCVSDVKPQPGGGKNNFVMILVIGLTAGLFRVNSAWLTYCPGLVCLRLSAGHEAPNGAAGLFVVDPVGSVLVCALPTSLIPEVEVQHALTRLVPAQRARAVTGERFALSR